MNNFTERHRIKFLRLLEKELKEIENPQFSNLVLVGKALSTSIFLETCNQKNGRLFSVDVVDYSYHFESKNRILSTAKMIILNLFKNKYLRNLILFI